MFPRLPARATFVADTNFVSGTQKMFLILFRNILCPQQMFPSLRSPRNIMSNNVSQTICPRLPVPLGTRVPRHVFQARAPGQNSTKYRAEDLCVNLVCEYFCWMLSDHNCFFFRQMTFFSDSFHYTKNKTKKSVIGKF